MKPQYWYRPHPSIRTQKAADRAKELAKSIIGQNDIQDEPDEHELFVALHTCAFRARQSNKKKTSNRDKTDWISLWHIIREYIVEQNIGLVYSTIGKFGPHKLDSDDLLSDAMFGLTRAVHRFSPWRGYKFSTYACNVIIRALVRHNKRETRYQQLFPVHYDVPFERPARLRQGNVTEELLVERLSRVLDRNLGGLTELETNIINQRFTEGEERRSTFREIGNAVGLSKERIRQMQNTALVKLRDTLAADPVLQNV